MRQGRRAVERGTVRRAGSGEARRDLARNGEEWQGGHGPGWRGEARCDEAGRGRYGKAWTGAVGHGKARKGRQGLARIGWTWIGMEWQVRHGVASRGWARIGVAGKAGEDWLGWAGLGTARQAINQQQEPNMATTERQWIHRTAGAALDMAKRMHQVGDIGEALSQVELARDFLLAIKLSDERDEMRREMADTDLNSLRRNGL